MMVKGIKTKQLQRNKAEFSSATELPGAKNLASLKTVCRVHAAFKPSDGSYGIFGGAPDDGAFRSRARAAPRASMAYSGMAPPPKAPAPMAEESYEAVGGDILYAQSSKTVQKCFKRDMLKLIID